MASSSSYFVFQIDASRWLEPVERYVYRTHSSTQLLVPAAVIADIFLSSQMDSGHVLKIIFPLLICHLDPYRYQKKKRANGYWR